MREVDAIVIGGGPAGAAVSAWLARWGRRVQVFERTRFPRFHVGESLVPGVNELLWELGVDEKIERAGFQVKRGGNLTSRSGAYVKFHLSLIADQLRKPYTFQVLRSRFDEILLDHSRERGADVHEGTEVADVLMDGERMVGVEVASPGRPARTVRAPIVIDASGRDALIATRFRLRHRDPVLNKVSIWGHFDGVRRDPGPDEGNLIAAVFEHGWFWIIPLAGGVTSVGAVVDAAAMKGGRRSPEARFQRFVEACPFVADRMRDATPAGPLETVSNLAYGTERFYGPGHVLIGDAAVFLDPIYSYGVYLALKTGKIVAERIDAGLRRGDLAPDLFESYEAELRREVRVVFTQIYNWYRFIGDTERVDRFVPLMIRWVTLRRSFSLLFSGMYDRLDPEGPPAMIQLLRKPLVDATSVPVAGGGSRAGRPVTS
jgi:halogenation protein CepH